MSLFCTCFPTTLIKFKAKCMEIKQKNSNNNRNNMKASYVPMDFYVKSGSTGKFYRKLPIYSAVRLFFFSPLDI